MFSSTVHSLYCFETRPLTKLELTDSVRLGGFGVPGIYVPVSATPGPVTSHFTQLHTWLLAPKVSFKCLLRIGH